MFVDQRTQLESRSRAAAAGEAVMQRSTPIQTTARGGAEREWACRHAVIRPRGASAGRAVIDVSCSRAPAAQAQQPQEEQKKGQHADQQRQRMSGSDRPVPRG
jgi:hypothetical protein